MYVFEVYLRDDIVVELEWICYCELGLMLFFIEVCYFGVCYGVLLVEDGVFGVRVIVVGI